MGTPSETNQPSKSGLWWKALFGLCLGVLIAYLAQSKHFGDAQLGTDDAPRVVTAAAEPAKSLGAVLKATAVAHNDSFQMGAEPLAAQREEFYPRDPDEWQGMLVQQVPVQHCSAEVACPLGMACNKDVCGPCTADSDCLAGESCALDHCVPKDQNGCRGREDCNDGELCVLSGYSSSLRGNDEMFSFCSTGIGAHPFVRGDTQGSPIAVVDERTPAERGPDFVLMDLVKKADKEHTQ
ncbi:MAG: hypothetical protein RL385_887 [Pseudomonadota bacterium]